MRDDLPTRMLNTNIIRNDREWRNEDYMYIGHDRSYEHPPAAHAQVVGAQSHRSYPTAPRVFPHSHTSGKVDKYYYHKRSMIAYNTMGSLARGSSAPNIERWDSDIDRGSTHFDSQVPPRHKGRYNNLVVNDALEKLFISESLKDEINKGIEASHIVLPGS